MSRTRCSTRVFGTGSSMSAEQVAKPVETSAVLRSPGRLGGARKAVARFFRDPKATVSVVILAVIITCAVGAPLLAPYGANEQDYTNSLAGPSLEHPLGTDRLGRDLLTRIMYGARISVSVGFI